MEYICPYRTIHKRNAYDRNGNITALQRYGRTGASFWGIVDNLTLTRTGNLLTSVSDSGSAVFSGDFNAASGASTYDADGALVSDTGRGISSVSWDEVGLPQTVSFSNGSSINYYYAADGTKLREVRTIVDDAGTVCETDDYYPLGGPLPTGSSTTLQPEKYQGKEWNPAVAINVYDFGARLYDPALGRWLAQDPLAEKYYPYSPYLFCAGNPMKFIDPEGKKVYIRNNNKVFEYHDDTLFETTGKEYSKTAKGFFKQALDALNSINKTEVGQQILFGLINSDNAFFIEEGTSRFEREDIHKAFAEEIKAVKPDLYNALDPSHFEGGSGGIIYWNPIGSLLPSTHGGLVNSTSDLFHEMVHANDANLGLLHDQVINGVKVKEWRAVYYENILRQQMGVPYRTHYIIEYDVQSQSVIGLDPYMLDFAGNPFLPNYL